jgi:hypothetical protein
VAAPPLSQRAPFAFADVPAASDDADLGMTAMQPNLKLFMQFWSRPEPVEVPTADWYANLLDLGASDSVPAASAALPDVAQSGDWISGASRAIERTVAVTDSAPVVCEIPFDDTNGADATSTADAFEFQRPAAAVERWAARPPASRVLAAANDASGNELAQSQPVSRSPWWWQTWDGVLTAPAADKAQRLPAAIAPVAWRAVHDELAMQLATAPESALGEQTPSSAWNASMPAAATVDIGVLAGSGQDDIRALAGRLRKTLG